MPFRGKRETGQYLSSSSSAFTTILHASNEGLSGTRVIVLSSIILANQTSTDTVVNVYITPGGHSGDPVARHLVMPITLYGTDYELIPLEGHELLTGERLVFGRPSQSVSYSVSYFQEL